MSIPSEFVGIHSAQQVGSLRVSLAATASEVEDSQRFRHDIFRGEMKANLFKRAEGRDVDEFDQHCLHLLVKDCESGQLVGSTRLLLNEGARAAGMFYLESEFEFDNILMLPGRFMEVGRTCLHPDYRTGAVARMLQENIAQQVIQHNIDYVISCASLSMGVDGAHAQAVIDGMRDKFFIPQELRVTPRLPLVDSASLPVKTSVVLPSLLKTYLSLGAMVGGEPCWNPEFNVADVFILLRSHYLKPGYARTLPECA